MKKIGVDVDGTIRDLMTGINQVFKTHYSEYIVSDIAHNYNFPHIQMSLDEKYDIIYNKYPKDIFLKTKPYHSAVAQFKILKSWCQKNDIKLVCATNQEPHLIGMTYKWLSKYGFIFEELYITKDKSNIGLDGIIDDAPHNYYDWINGGNLEENFFLINRDWNQDVAATNRINKITDIIKKII